ncbi:MAG TPA: hypothetical protein VGS41_02105, partial [Chthonomonadales bacterium]|nr:hypothetical protein [Chthonomonadales bacterium]
MVEVPLRERLESRARLLNEYIDRTQRSVTRRSTASVWLSAAATFLAGGSVAGAHVGLGHDVHWRWGAAAAAVCSALAGVATRLNREGEVAHQLAAAGDWAARMETLAIKSRQSLSAAQAAEIE